MLLTSAVVSGAEGEVAVKCFSGPSWTEKVRSCLEGLSVAGAASVTRMFSTHF